MVAWFRALLFGNVLLRASEGKTHVKSEGEKRGERRVVEGR